MNVPHLLGACCAFVAIGWFAVPRDDAASLAPTPGSTPVAAPPAAAPTTPPTTPPPRANGHYVLVVEGDRSALAITQARFKTAPWAGVPQGFTSDWLLTVRDAAGTELTTVPLDVTPFAVDPARQGTPVQVEGCVVRDSRIGMLVNVPAFANAASYTFARGVGAQRVVLGQVDGARVRTLAEGGR